MNTKAGKPKKTFGDTEAHSPSNFPPLLARLKLQPYVAHNFFVDLTDASDFTGSGFSSGASLRLSRNLTGDFYYRWQTSRYDGVWYDYTIFGTAIRMSF